MKRRIDSKTPSDLKKNTIFFIYHRAMPRWPLFENQGFLMNWACEYVWHLIVIRLWVIADYLCSDKLCWLSTTPTLAIQPTFEYLGTPNRRPWLTQRRAARTRLMLCMAGRRLLRADLSCIRNTCWLKICRRSLLNFQQMSNHRKMRCPLYPFSSYSGMSFLISCISWLITA